MLIPIAVVVVATNVYVAGESALCSAPHHNVHFGYHFGSEDDPSHWHELDKDTHCCDGSNQSPININTQDAKCAKLDPIQYLPKYRKEISGSLKINGHGASLAFFKNNLLMTKNIPFSDAQYVLHSIHFHSPSEHLVDGKRFDGELHLVHYNKRYGSVGASVGKEDGLAVVGVFLEVIRSLHTLSIGFHETKGTTTFSSFYTLRSSLLSDSAIVPQVAGESEDNAFNRFVDGVAKLKGDEAENVSLDPRELLLMTDDYYTYKGSLTTPPCSESVRWVVMDLPVLTTTDRLKVLKKVPVSGGDPLSVDTNVRPAQPVNGRPIYVVCW
ncbi:carbonic anhydrase 2-like isoform X1 [Haliotis asinina]|uniref:carbonic anhydrase 2-like isoform X1 n=1 Tax=Haliotis asinina TaxID=109174 RepID=UPI0035327940